ncbi:MAG TPA: YbaK/EbsC family protein [Candidatus Limnocylindrales bacterium]|jgi:Ala-tRNA(Pro) deacylase
MLLRTHSMLPMPTAPMPVNVPMNALLDWLGAHGIGYDLHEHPLAFTALEAARAEGLDPHAFVKTLAVGRSDGRRALIAIEASDHLDLEAAARLLDTDRIRLLTEFELLDLAPSCDVGALPPIGDLFGVPVFADVALLDVDRITFHAGSHRHAVRLARRDWERSARVRFGRIATMFDPLAAALTEWTWY